MYTAFRKSISEHRSSDRHCSDPTNENRKNHVAVPRGEITHTHVTAKKVPDKYRIIRSRGKRIRGKNADRSFISFSLSTEKLQTTRASNQRRDERTDETRYY